MSAKGGKTPTTKMKEVKSMAKKIGIIVLLCFSLCVGGVSAFANEGHDETDTQTLIETQPPVSSVLFRQDGADIQQSTDEGKTWQSYSPIEETDYFTYDEFSAWIENETENIQKLVDAGEWTEAEATEALEYYDEILKSILEGKMVGKRASSSDDQLYFAKAASEITDCRFAIRSTTPEGLAFSGIDNYINIIYTVGGVGEGFQGISFDYQLYFQPPQPSISAKVDSFFEASKKSFFEEILKEEYRGKH